MINFFPDWFGRSEEHISDDDLLALLDGELSIGSTRRANRHLESCWQCRARYEQVEQTIVKIVGYRSHIAAPFLPPPLDGRDKFLAKVDELFGQPKISRVSSLIGRFTVRSVIEMRSILASVAVVLIAALALFLIWGRRVPTVSAAELLQRAEAWDRRPSSATQGGVIFQKVRIRTKKVTIDRAVYRDVADRRRLRLSPLRQDEAEVNRELTMAGIDWQQPLSATNFREWHDRLPEKTDRVASTDPEILTLVTDSDSGDVKESSLSVRKADFHPIGRRVLMRDSEELEISEVNYDVLGWDAVNAESLFEPMPTTVVPKSEAANSFVNVMETELQVRYALHNAGADLGEPIDIHIGTQGRSPVSVIGILSSPERKQELLAALSGISRVSTELQTEDEAARVTLPRPASAKGDSEPKVVSKTSPIEKELLEHFGSPTAVEEFSKRALYTTDRLMARAWALRHLSDRYGDDPSQLQPALSRSSRQLLEAMRRDHYRAMSDATKELDNMLAPVLHSIVRGGQESESSSSPTPVFSTAREIQCLTLELLSGAESPETTDTSEPDKAVQDLLVALHQLRTTLGEQP